MKRDSSFTWRRVESSNLDLKGKKVAIVGGTGGIGRALSRLLAARGASVIVVGQTFRDADLPAIEFIKADLSSLRESKRVAALLPAETLDLLVFTTGIFAAPQRQVTAEGIERDMATSYLSRMAMMDELVPRLGTKRPAGAGAPKPRVFIWGFPGTGQAGKVGDLNAEREYSSMAVHMNTVAGNEMLVLDAAKRYANASFFGFNPGLIKTSIRSNFLGEDSLKFRVIETLIGLMTPTVEQYAERIAPLLVAAELEGRTGLLFDRKGNAIAPSPNISDTHMKTFLDESAALVARATG